MNNVIFKKIHLLLTEEKILARPSLITHLPSFFLHIQDCSPAVLVLEIQVHDLIKRD